MYRIKRIFVCLQALALIGEFNNWEPKPEHWAFKNDFGVFCLFLPDNPDGTPAIPHRCVASSAAPRLGCALAAVRATRAAHSQPPCRRWALNSSQLPPAGCNALGKQSAGCARPPPVHCMHPCPAAQRADHVLHATWFPACWVYNAPLRARALPARSTKVKARLETAYGEWVERIPAWIKWATQVRMLLGPCSPALQACMVQPAACIFGRNA